ncbi:hypothetical protein [Nitrosomonas sp. Nm58]|uniref:restriction endonuclease n=1 Tax=Nitrosomonas sp. Nm58 TaxID=200126 RepID=UPI003528A020
MKYFLKHDLTYFLNFSDVWTCADWANQQNMDSRDVGIDLVVKLADEDGRKLPFAERTFCNH